MASNPSETFHRLLLKWEQELSLSNCPLLITKIPLSPQCKNYKLKFECIAIDIFWYPIDDNTHRNWYDVRIITENIAESFIGTLEEFGRDMEIFKNILILADITTNSESASTTKPKKRKSVENDIILEIAI